MCGKIFIGYLQQITMKYIVLLLVLIVFAFTTCEPENNLDHTQDYTLYTSISSDLTASFSSNGSQIAYIHRDLVNPNPKDYPNGLYIINNDGTGRKLVMSGIHQHPSWSQDDKWLVLSTEGTIQVISTNAESIKTCELFTDPMFHPDWSPNGKQIIFSTPLGNSGTYISDPEFKSGRKFFETQGLSSMEPSWSPDNDKIIYVKPLIHSEELFIFDTIKKTEVQITSNGKLNRSPVWSPNGLLIAWSKSNKIAIAGIDGKNEKILGVGRFPSWASDSKSLIYSGPTNDLKKEVIWQINVDGSNKTQITN